MNHSDVIKNFRNGKNYKGCNVFADGDILYSYGRHFPLAVRREEKNKTWYLLNGDKYSVSTAKHQGKTYSTFSDQPRVSFSALSAAGLDYFTCKLIDFTKDQYASVYPGDKGFDAFRKSIPVGAEYHEKREKDGSVIYKSYHRVGTAVLEQNKKHYICAMDEGSYFISLLPHKVKTVDEAFQALKPRAVKEAETIDSGCKRQGEWFFIPAALNFKDSQFQKNSALPSVDSSSNQHICTRLLKTGNKFFR